jgi:hypothetical protein
MLKPILVFFGPMYSGKTTCANIAAETIENSVIFSFSTPIKELGAAIGINCHANKTLMYPEYQITARQFMRSMGDLLRSFNIHSKYSYTTVVMKMRIEKVDARVIIIDDLRYKEEYEMLSDIGAIFIRVSRKSAPVDESHSSETEACNFRAHHNIVNNSNNTDQVRLAISQLCSTLQ